MIAGRIATALFVLSLAIVAGVIGFIEWPTGAERSCAAYPYAFVLYLLAAYVAACLLVVSLIVRPLWWRAAVFVLAVTPYPLIVMSIC